MANKFLIKSGNVFFKYRNFLFPLFVIFILLFTKPGLFLNSGVVDRFAVAGGFIIAFLGIIFRCIVIGFAYIKRGGKDGKVYADNLVAKGFYAHTRNPMYIGNFSILTGLGIIYGSLFIYIVIIPLFVFVYLSIIAAEEDYLRKRFGRKYEDYCRRTPRFIPNLRGLKKSLEEFHYDWRKAIRKDYGTFFGTIAGSYSILLWKRHLLYGFPSNNNELIIPAVIFFLIAAGYITVRYFKKSGRLK